MIGNRHKWTWFICQCVFKRLHAYTIASGLAKIKCSCVKNKKLFQMLLKVKETVVDLNIYMQTKTKHL